ncbi:hypothetical protein ACWA5Z_06845 [Testudinibacter sp. P80/BLE/0925]
MASCRDLRGYQYENADFMIRCFWDRYQGFNITEKMNLMFLPSWQYSRSQPAPKDPDTIDIWDREWLQVSAKAMNKSQMLKIEYSELLDRYPGESALREHRARVDLAYRRMFKLNKLQGRRESCEVAGQIRISFIKNFNPSKLAFQCVQNTEFLQDAYFWLGLTIRDFLSLNDNLQALIDITQKANAARLSDPEQFEILVEQRKETLKKFGLESY